MPTDDIREQLVTYLKDVHGAEENAISQLRSGADAVHSDRLKQVLQDHLRETEEHERLVRTRLGSYGETPSSLKDLAHKGIAAVTGAVSGAAPDTTGKVAIQAFAFEHLEIASYRMLRTVAQRAGDRETVQMADRILVDEEAAAEKLNGLLEEAAIVGLPQTTTV